MTRKTFKKELTPWDQFAEQCILGCYSGKDGESIANKNVHISPHRSITKAQQLGRLLESENIQTLTDLDVFEKMNDLRAIGQTA